MAESDKPRTPRAGRDLPVAIGVGLALLAPIVVGLVWFHWLFIVYVALLLCLGVVEVSRAVARKDMRAETVPIVIGTALIIVGGYFVTVAPDVGVSTMTFTFSCLVGMMLASFVIRLFRGPAEGFIRDVAASSLIIVYLPLIGVFVALLLAPDNGAARIWAILIAVVASDTGAFAVGVLFGKHKMAPDISPSKTWEGFAGGVGLSVIVSVASAVFLLDMAWWIGIAFGVFVSIAGTVGDLAESLIKRDAGIKDMSNWLPGHGGVMDRLDSMVMAFPVGWFILNLAMGS
ncbi:MAG: phosphatidate cytidylyltransferase [Propionibacterium sp.]|nr:phosphatidate cytidylyltransferase [Propionibacterium sp.]